MVTTIQLKDNVKESLNKMKEHNRESYEDIILRMMNIVEKQKRAQTKLLVEGYKEMSQHNLKICKDWEKIDSELDWEWNEKNAD